MKQKTLTPLFSEAIDDMNEYMGVKKFYQTQVFEYNPAEFDEFGFAKNSASGRRPGPMIPPEYDPDSQVERNFSCNGSKIDQHSFYAGKARAECQAVYDGEKHDIEYEADSGYMIPKRQGYPAFGETEKERIKEVRETEHKIRDFFILTYFTILIGCLVSRYRQVRERGNLIKIGTTWWYGGAERFAEEMRYQDPNMRWFDGDFRGLDRTLNRQLLNLYLFSSLVYWDFGRMSAGSIRLLKALLNFIAKSISIKSVNVFGRQWFTMYGGMPSGIYETSHGDSWIVAFLFFLFVRYTIATHKKGWRVKIMQQRHRILFVVYGDDHIMGVDVSIADVINEKNFADFVGKYFLMQIRDARDISRFTSSLNPDGTLCRAGVVFLQRYFIDNMGRYPGLPEILPVRPISKIILNFAYGSSCNRTSVADYLLGIVGQAFDCGFNKPAYSFCKYMWQELGGCLDADWKTLLLKKQAHGNDKDLSKLFNRVGLTFDELEKGFPSWSRIKRMHVRNDLKNEMSTAKIFDFIPVV